LGGKFQIWGEGNFPPKRPEKNTGYNNKVHKTEETVFGMI